KVEGKPVFNVNLNLSTVNQLEPNATYAGEEYLQHVLDIRQAFGQPIDSPVHNYLEAIEQENYLATPDHQPTVTDPWSYFLQPAYNNSANISFANSTESTNQFISLGVRDQQGVIMNDNFRQITARVNIESNITDWLIFSINTSYAGTDDSGIQPTPARAVGLSPYASIFDENGNYNQFPQTTTSVPSAHWDIATDHSSIRHNLLGNIQTKLTLAKGLVLTSLYSNNYRSSNGAIFYASEDTHIGQAARGQGSRSNGTNHYQLFDNFLSFDRQFAEKHQINATLLYSIEKTVFNNHSLSGREFENEVLGHYGLNNAVIQTVSTGGGESAALGQMARINYSFDEKYNLTGTVRRDGFSGFSRDKKWGIFSSVAASWNVIEESFLHNSGVISNLKLSASYGSVGNRAIGPYSTLARVGTGRTIFAGSNDFVVTQSINSFATNNLGWEKTTGLNLGVDFGLFQDRISGRLDAYQTTTRDLIFDSAIPAISGGPATIRDNVGELGNKGIELTLNSLNVSRPDFRWNSNFNFSLNRNKVISIFGEDNDGDGVEDDLLASNIFIGRPLGEIYTYKVIGMWQQEDVENGTIMDGMRPGDYKGEDLPFVTTDASGNEITEEPDGRLTSDKDRQFIGNSGINFTWSLTNTASYKNFSLMVYVYSLWGGNGWYQSTNAPYRSFGAYTTPVNTVVYDYWTPENTDAVFPRPDYIENAAFRIDQYFDRSFIKLQKIALTYDFTQLVRPYNITGLRATISADNLGLYAPYWEGLDPETGQGLQVNSRPSLRTILFSVALNF
ncbi:MAG: SusC/RagA family TonB-linked outer membrane protein, partial [Cyclobacterium sp.]|uniref:SusC/RagA family TonB-linked outer membrane protein n=1 Tax=Cyclobacterium sp. TaxID=1966343 RepID=UPI00397113B3